MKAKFKTSKKSMRVLITILISLVCINSALMVATIISSATVTPVESQDDATNNFTATKISEMQISKIEAKIAPAITNKEEVAAVKPKPATSTKTVTTTSKESTKATTTKASTTTPKESTEEKSVTPKDTEVVTEKAATTSTSGSSTSGTSTLKNSVNSSLMNAFDQLKFKIVIKSNSKYLGYFSTSKHSLEMRSVSVSTFRHEMGHFLDVLKNMPSRSSKFVGIYSRERSEYTGTNAAYVTKNAQEYFAQSYRNYLESASKLKAERPETYAFIKAQITSIANSDISRTYNMYSWSW